jgi:hypothetical protein
MRRILAATLLFSSVAMADEVSQPPTPPVGARVAWTVIAIADSNPSQWFLPGKTTVQLATSVPWSCSMRPLRVSSAPLPNGYETVTIDCTTADAEVRFEQDCWYRKQPRPGGVGSDRRWRLGKRETYRVAAKGHPERAISLSLACDVDARYEM